MRPGAVATFPKPHPLDAGRTLLRSPVPGTDPSTRRAVDGAWRACRTPAGPATVQVREDPHEVVATVWGDGGEWLLDRLPAMLGFGDRRDGFDPSPHPLVAELARRDPGLRFGASQRLVEALVPTILGQRVTVGEAARSYRALVRVLGDPAPGPADLRLPPSPSRLARLSAFQLHRFGIDSGRAATIIGVCRRAATLERWVDRPSADAAAALSSLRGIGPWTVTTVQGLVWGDPDAPVVGDVHLPHSVAWVLAGEARATDARMLELLAPFAGHRGRVQRLVVRAGHAPRRGPRQRVLPVARL